MGSSDEEQDDTTGDVATRSWSPRTSRIHLGEAVAPEAYKIVDSPALETSAEKEAFIGKTVLAARWSGLAGG